MGRGIEECGWFVVLGGGLLIALTEACATEVVQTRIEDCGLLILVGICPED